MHDPPEPFDDIPQCAKRCLTCRGPCEDLNPGAGPYPDHDTYWRLRDAAKAKKLADAPHSSQQAATIPMDFGLFG